ncbi:amylo-alpha-1,6-glucosidase [Myxosarcina sp. GI1]|uniref:amylo-alpha-1,6-glucosidase n=1 Tax=Myxosarcina sp. GI1 TaxID=1541065 RepID=UPI000907D714|nr:amylo-alpha-1,6-glucosidase [Myxosarcina sp. GI1]
MSAIGRGICNDLVAATEREWLVTNGIGGFACGTVSGILTRAYHGLAIAALKPPGENTLMLTKLAETVEYIQQEYALDTNLWGDGAINPSGYLNIETFALEGTIPVWSFACADALLNKRVWMEWGENTTYIDYDLVRASQPLTLQIKVLINYRDRHSNTRSDGWQTKIEPIDRGICITVLDGAKPLYLSLFGVEPNNVKWHLEPIWYYNFYLAVENYRGLANLEDHLYVATFSITLQPEAKLTVIASTEEKHTFNRETAYQRQRDRDLDLIEAWNWHNKIDRHDSPPWIEQLVIAADRFIVDRLPGKTIIAGYPWFTDWGRDTMISLPGLTLSTGRFEIARDILRTFARYIDRGMLPNVFPDRGDRPEYNTVDATFWYFEAIRDYYDTTKDRRLLAELFPQLLEIIDWHVKGTRHNIHLDDDGLIYAGEAGVQLTWMDAKVDDWVVTPRIGKPIEVNALWYNALTCMAYFCRILGYYDDEVREMMATTRTGFQKFWNAAGGYCFDAIDTPNGNDKAFRPNQIFAVSLPNTITSQQSISPLFDRARQRQIVDKVAQTLLTSYGLRSLASTHPDYVGIYGGDRYRRDGAYHQGTTWAWLIGHFVQAHLTVYRDPQVARSFIEPMAQHLQAGCLGNISEIFDGDKPFTPRGCFAQAWSVGEVLRAWQLILHGDFSSQSSAIVKYQQPTFNTADLSFLD